MTTVYIFYSLYQDIIWNFKDYAILGHSSFSLSGYKLGNVDKWGVLKKTLIKPIYDQTQLKVGSKIVSSVNIKHLVRGLFLYIHKYIIYCLSVEHLWEHCI